MQRTLPKFKRFRLSADSANPDAANPAIEQATSETSNLAAQPAELPGTRLRSRLLSTILPAVLLPLVAGGVLGYRIISQRTESFVQKQLVDQALLTSEGATTALNELLDLPRTIANSPLVINEARAGGEEAIESGLAELSVAAAEAEYSDSKLLRRHNALNTYLQKTVETAEIVEILVTERHGFNVAYSRPVADFVQRDEDWWQNGQSNQQWIGPPNFDFAAKGFTVELAQAIRDPKDDSFVGVVRAVLPTRKFSLLVNALKRTGISGSQRVQLVDGGTLSTIDTFSAQGFRKDREIIGGKPVEQFIGAFVSATQEKTDANQVLKKISTQTSVKQPSVPFFDESAVVASFKAGDRQYKVATIPSSNWVAIASMENSEILAAGRDSLLFFTLLTLLLAGITTGLIFWLSRQLSAPLASLTQQARLAAAGDLGVVATPTGTAETRFLTQTFNQLVTQASTLLEQQRIETQKAQLFANVTSASALTLTEFNPVLDQSLQGARQLLGADRVVFYRVEANEAASEPRTEATRRQQNIKGQIVAESAAPELAIKQSYPENIHWLPTEALTQETSLAASRNALVSQPPTVTCYIAEVSDERYRAFLETCQVRASLSVPVFQRLANDDVPGGSQSILWGYMVVHHCRSAHTWQANEIGFVEQLCAQLEFVLERITATERVRRSHQETQQSKQEVERSQLAAEALTLTQKQQENAKRQHEKRIQQQVSQLAQDIEGVFHGDLTVRARVDEGELKAVADVFNLTITKLEALVAQVKHSTHQIDSFFTETEQIAQQLSDTSSQQVQAANRTFKTIRVTSLSIASIASRAQDAAEIAHQVSDKAQVSETASAQALAKIQALEQTSTDAVSTIERLLRPAHNVSYMSAMLTEIAAEMKECSEQAIQAIEQTSSENGRSPSDHHKLKQKISEIAKLSEKAISEVSLIETFLDSVPQTTRQVVEAMTQVNQQMASSHQTVHRSQQATSEALAISRQFEQSARFISQATQEQSQASQSATSLVEAAADLAMQTSSFSQEMARSLQRTLTTAHELRSSVDFFNVEASEKAPKEALEKISEEISRETSDQPTATGT
ncbi:MAG: GAF domain-containing protein [Phormidesmis sp.]